MPRHNPVPKLLKLATALGFELVQSHDRIHHLHDPSGHHLVISWRGWVHRDPAGDLAHGFFDRTLAKRLMKYGFRANASAARGACP
jgi:hypothetical protein